MPVYSTGGLLSPIVLRNGKIAPSLSLVSLRVATRRGEASSRLSDQRRNTIADLLRGCILDGQDILLPHRRSNGFGETFFIVARADEPGAVAIQRRILGQLSGHRVINEVGAELAASYSVLDLGSMHASEPSSALVERVVSMVERFVEEQNGGQESCDARE